LPNQPMNYVSNRKGYIIIRTESMGTSGALRLTTHPHFFADLKPAENI